MPLGYSRGGNFGIGIGSPESTLHVAKTGGADLRISNLGTSIIPNGFIGSISWNAPKEFSGGYAILPIARISVYEGGGPGLGATFNWGAIDFEVSKVGVLVKKMRLNTDGTLNLKGAFNQEPLSTDPTDPAAGQSLMWVSDGTGSGDAGDVMMKINVGGTTKVITLVDYSAAP